MKKLIYLLLLLPFSLFAQSGGVYGIAMYQSPQTQYKQTPDNGSMIYVCDSAKSEFNEGVYLRYIRWKSKVITTPLYGGHKYIGEEKLKAKEIRALFAGSKLNGDSASAFFSSIRAFAKKKTIVDRDGKYEIPGLPPGAYYVMIERANEGIVFKQGEEEVQKIIINPGDKKEIDFEY